MSARSRRGSVRRRVVLVAGIPLLVLAATFGVVGWQLAASHRAADDTIDVADLLDALADAINDLGIEHLVIRQQVALPQSERTVSPSTWDDSTRSLDALATHLREHEGPGPRNLGLADRFDLLRNQLMVIHELIPADHGDTPAVRQHQAVVDELVTAVRTVALELGGGTSIRTSLAVADLAEVWVAFLDEDAAVAAFLDRPTELRRIGAQTASQRLSDRLDLTVAEAGDDRYLETAEYREVVELLDGVVTPTPVTVETWNASQELRAQALVDQLDQASDRHVRAIDADHDRGLRVLFFVIVLAVAAVAVTGLFAFRLSRSIARRLEALLDGADALERGEFPPAPAGPDGGDDEIDVVQRSFAAVGDRLLAFGTEADRLAAAVIEGNDDARGDTAAFRGRWRAVVEGLDEVVRRHREVRVALVEDTERMTALEALARASIDAGSVVDVLDRAGHLVMTATRSAGIEYWERHGPRMRRRLTTLDDPLGGEHADSLSAAMIDALDRDGAADHIGGWDVLVEHIQDSRGPIGLLLLVEPARAVPESVRANVAALLRAVAVRHELARKDEHDRLHERITGLPNAAALRVALAERIAHHVDLDESAYLAQIRFVNANPDEAAESEWLRRVATQLRIHLPGEWWLAHVGGVEFAVLSGNPGIEGQVRRVVDQVLAGLANPVAVTASIGLVAVEDVAEPDAATVLLAARQACRATSERERVVWFSSDLGRRAGRDARVREQLRSELRGGGEHHFRLEYQPIVSFSSRRVVAVEALARWDPPDLGSPGPGEFVPLAETMGLVEDLDRLLADIALRELGTTLRDDLRLVLNVSAHELSHGDYAGQLTALAVRHGVPLRWLGIELTETAMVAEGVRGRVADQLRRLADGGADIVVDDFGTGHASLAYVTGLPVSKVKIDRSFITRVHERDEALTIVETVVSMSLQLGLAVVAEGIETIEELRVVHGVGCDQGQGWLFARSVPVDALADTIAMVESALTDFGLSRRSERTVGGGERWSIR